jgi:hypothetical protein
MKKILLAALLAIATPALAQPAPAPAAPAAAVPNTPKDWSVIAMTMDIARPADVTWQRIGGNDYCAIIKFLNMNSCTYTVGSGDVGTNRVLNGTIHELLVAKTGRSYTYAQPTSPIFYHGTMAVEPVSPTSSRIVYTLIYDQAPLPTPDAKAASRDRRRASFMAALERMKAAAEATP